MFSKRFWTVLWLALTAEPNRALGALAALATGKRLRAWNQLHWAAAENSSYYKRWIALAEPGLQSAWIDATPAKTAAAKRIAVLLVTGDHPDALEASKRSIRQALGADIQVIPLDACPGKTKAAIAASGADWVLPVQAGDLLDSLLGRALHQADPALAAIYWDEDSIIAGRRARPWAKPLWDPLLFGQYDGLLSASLLRTMRVLQHWDDAFAPGPDGGAFADQLRKLCRKVASHGAFHIPLILTHRGGPLADPIPMPSAAPADWPSVSIIIPTRDLPEDLANCLSGLERLGYPGRVETIIIDNGSTDPAALALLARQAERPGIQVLRAPGPFNFARLNNDAVQVATGELLCFLNNDVEPLDGSWLARLAGEAIQPDVGAVGAMLLYPDGTVQHAGVAIGIGGAAGHVQKGLSRAAADLAPWYVATRRVSAVTAACLVVGRAKFLAVGGFDAVAFPVAFNDVDLCLKLDASGLRNLFVADARLVHHESKSRGQDDDPVKRDRFAQELQQLQGRWQTRDHDDPWYSPLFSRSAEQCLLQI